MTNHPVQKTPFKDIFKNSMEEDVILLGDEKANKLWEEEIDPKASSYFYLPDDHWLISSPSFTIGEWLEAYNTDNNLFVETILRKNINYSKDSLLYFIARKNTIFLTKWSYFLKNWDEFIAVEDDCPILMLVDRKKRSNILVFKPLGDIDMIKS
jgi:hypothetical protein